MAGNAEARKAITTPALDLFCIGGGLVIAVAFVMLFRVKLDVPDTGLPISLMLVGVLHLLFNYPHFMASYRMLYQRPELIARHRWASTYVPLLLLGYIAFIFYYARATGTPEPVWAPSGKGVVPFYCLAEYVASMYLAVHYTGQAWGMMASMGYLTGFPIGKRDRQILRGVLKLFLVWHIAAYHHLSPAMYQNLIPWIEPYVRTAWRIATFLAHGGMALAVLWFVFMSRRERRPLPWRVWVPMVALYLGYIAVSERGFLGGMFLLQIGHALQYLIFPMRVEMNRATERGITGNKALLRHMLIYGALLFAAGWIAFVVAGHLQPTHWVWASMTFLVAVNIHHYFIDGVIWKISTPEVKKDLFRHVMAVK